MAPGLGHQVGDHQRGDEPDDDRGVHRPLQARRREDIAADRGGDQAHQHDHREEIDDRAQQRD